MFHGNEHQVARQRLRLLVNHCRPINFVYMACNLLHEISRKIVGKRVVDFLNEKHAIFITKTSFPATRNQNCLSSPPPPPKKTTLELVKSTTCSASIGYNIFEKKGWGGGRGYVLLRKGNSPIRVGKNR